MMARKHRLTRYIQRSRVVGFIAFIFLLVGISLISINLYGLTQPMRKPGLGVTDHEQLRFIPESVWSYQDSMDAIRQISPNQPTVQVAEEANQVVKNSLVHISWTQVDPVEYRQLVPIWENYLLHAIGRFSGLPQFERYHYADYKRSIQRGIGICGDASTALSSLLDNHDISNRIISFKGHVIVEYEPETGSPRLLDPDFGVSLGMSLESLIEDPSKARSQYLDAGYSEPEVAYLFTAYESSYSVFEDTFHFMSLRYVFEYASYVIKWLLPVLLIIISTLALYIKFQYRILESQS